jgi:hypothetical protein
MDENFDCELLDGAGLAQAIVDIGKGKNLQPDLNIEGFRKYDSAEDRKAIQIGIDLWKQYRDDLQPADIIWAIEHSNGLETR